MGLQKLKFAYRGRSTVQVNQMLMLPRPVRPLKTIIFE